MARPSLSFSGSTSPLSNGSSESEPDDTSSSVQEENGRRRKRPREGECLHGRWTDEEHQTFVEALRLYGRDWKKVGQLIKSRTSAQIRSHAQKYYQRLARREAQRRRQATFTSTLASADPVNLSRQRDAVFRAVYEHTRDPILANQISAKAIDGLAASTTSSSPEIGPSSASRGPSLPVPRSSLNVGGASVLQDIATGGRPSDYSSQSDPFVVNKQSSNHGTTIPGSFLPPQMSSRERERVERDLDAIGGTANGVTSTQSVGLGLMDFSFTGGGRPVHSSSSSSTTTPASSDRTPYDMPFYDYQPNKPIPSSMPKNGLTTTNNSTSNNNHASSFYPPTSLSSQSSLDSLARNSNRRVEDLLTSHLPLSSTGSSNAVRSSFMEAPILLSLGRKGMSPEEFERELRESERIALEVLCSQRMKSSNNTVTNHGGGGNPGNPLSRLRDFAR